MNQSNSNTPKNAKELAFLYDLVVTPQWREPFDEMVDEEVELPKEGKFLDAECGTGGYTIDMVIRGGPKTEVVGVDPSPEKLALARAKAIVKKVERVEFREGSLLNLGFPDDEFDLVIGDASMLEPAKIGPALTELSRVAKKGAKVVLKLTTRGSFDEFFSIYWEALYNEGLLNYVPQLEGLITERLTVSDAEQIAKDAGLKQVQSVTRKERFDFADGKEFLQSPLIDTFFLHDWLAILPNDEARQQVQEQLIRIIDEGCYNSAFDLGETEVMEVAENEDGELIVENPGEEGRHKMDFDISIKATLIIGKK
jgi:ubiquinone/menaquinone biosynthesis C-methylase UbiE